MSAPERSSLIDYALRRERGLVVVALVALTGLAWAWTLSGAGMAHAGATMQPPSLTLLLAMWWVMMAAMMLPSAAPMVLLYGRVRQQQGERAGVGSTWVFLAGYLLAWLGVSALATLLQLLTARFGLIDAMTMRSTSSLLAGVTLIAVGAYQFTPVKDACLASCRSPASFLARHWRPGIQGALRVGLVHGIYCIGCCWALMALLFVGGVMNFLWIGALALLVAAEKLARRGPLIARLSGVALLLWGTAKLAL